MARGFESKDVEFQQAEADRAPAKGKALTPAERDAQAKRRSVELALLRARVERASATNPHHCGMLDRAIHALEDELASNP